MNEQLPKRGIVKMKWSRKAKVGETTGAFDYAQKNYDWSARIREVTVTVRTLDLEEARKWKAFFLRLDGRLGRFDLTPSGGEYPAGAIYDEFGRWHGSAVVNGTNQTGKILNVSGLPPNEEAALCEGDWFSLGGVLHESKTDVASDGNGNGTIQLWRALQVAPDNGEVLKLNHPTGTFKLLSDIPDMSWTKEKREEGFTFRAREVLL